MKHKCTYENNPMHKACNHFDEKHNKCNLNKPCGESTKSDLKDYEISAEQASALSNSAIPEEYVKIMNQVSKAIISNSYEGYREAEVHVDICNKRVYNLVKSRLIELGYKGIVMITKKEIVFHIEW